MKRWLLVVPVLLLGVAAYIFWPRADRIDSPAPQLANVAAVSDPVARGQQLVTLGDCKACHTAQGGAPYAGGRAIVTPFGTFYSPNITPDQANGIGSWSADDFWRALHHGRGKNGEPLYPSFPYTNYTRVSRADADAMYAYLRSVPAAAQANRAHELKFPYNIRLALIGWRALFFRPGVYQSDPARDAQWNRGAYLVQGLGHCSACHEARNALGAIQSQDNPAGGLVLNWYAPSLRDPHEAGLADWREDEIVALLQTGVARGAATLGPMAEVVYESLQHVDVGDLQAMASYLRSLPQAAAGDSAPSVRVSAPQAQALIKQGEPLYAEHCASCHGDRGEGRAPAAPALAGNRALLLRSAVNPIHVVLYGGYAPGTQNNPRPYGMPPFAQALSDEQVAAVLSYTRAAWGNAAPAISPVEVMRNRSGPLW